MLRITSLSLVAALMLGGCDNSRGPRGVFMPVKEVLTDPYGVFAATGPYRLDSGDRLRIVVFGQDQITNAYAVDAAGQLAVPLIGTVNALGRTTQDVEREIARRLADGYLRSPNVSVEVEQYRPFFVMGEVMSSGQYPYVSGMSVQNAVAIAGGFAPRAKRDSVEISRKINGVPMKAMVPPAYIVKPGDIITVKERWF